MCWTSLSALLNKAANTIRGCESLASSHNTHHKTNNHNHILIPNNLTTHQTHTKVAQPTKPNHQHSQHILCTTPNTIYTYTHIQTAIICEKTLIKNKTNQTNIFIMHKDMQQITKITHMQQMHNLQRQHTYNTNADNNYTAQNIHNTVQNKQNNTKKHLSNKHFFIQPKKQTTSLSNQKNKQLLFNQTQQPLQPKSNNFPNPNPNTFIKFYHVK